MNPSLLHFSRSGSLFKAIVFAAFVAALFWLAYELANQSTEPVKMMPLPGVDLPAIAPRKQPLIWLKMPFLLFMGCIMIFFPGRYWRRAFTQNVAVKIEQGAVHFDSSYMNAPDALPLEKIRLTIFDRADRLLGDGGLFTSSWSAKQGSKLRYGLYIEFQSGSNSTDNIRLVDNDFEGGKQQLQGFAEYLEKMRLGKIRFLDR